MRSLPSPDRLYRESRETVRDAPANTLACPDCGEVFPGRGPESARGIRQRVTKHRRKKHGYPSPEELINHERQTTHPY